MRKPAPGLAFVFLWFLVGGIAHFAFTETEMRIVPPWLPWPPLAIVLVTGVFELAGAAGLLLPRTRRWAAWGLFALTVAVTPANVYMLQHAERFPGVPYWALVARLPLQVLLLVLIARVALRAR
ncbi:DoxX family protein [Ramlibacter sp. XY19]|uniref:DoxX family protein n=1 Tax=Ramlibacter paludis TaxID=2908000 RepID=UPI0023DAF5CD|nr:DoxX family protein [Ramlibacter paludis]MCG2591500.1 DoxX family protein [Ramlibacter paludis]